MCSGHQDSAIIIEQVQGVGAKRDRRQAMRVATQGMDEVTVGGHFAETVAIHIEHRCPDDNAMPDGVGNKKHTVGREVDGIDIGGGIQALVQQQGSGVKPRLCSGQIAVGGKTYLVLGIVIEQFQRK